LICEQPSIVCIKYLTRSCTRFRKQPGYGAKTRHADEVEVRSFL